MAKERLAKILARSNIASRRNSEQLIFEGKVSVNGEIVLKPQTMVDSQKDEIKVGGKKIELEKEKYYFLFNKPKNVLCSNRRMHKEKLAVDFFKRIEARLFTVGRLDGDVTGLLIVTNDGHFAHSIIHPSFNIEKEYIAKVKQKITEEHLRKIRAGVLIENRKIRPKQAVKKGVSGCLITVMEGKKHEVKLLVENAGLELISLARIRLGGLRLGHLKEGEYRKLNAQEIASFKSIIWKS